MEYSKERIEEIVDAIEKLIDEQFPREPLVVVEDALIGSLIEMTFASLAKAVEDKKITQDQMKSALTNMASRFLITLAACEKRYVEIQNRRTFERDPDKDKPLQDNDPKGRKYELANPFSVSEGPLGEKDQRMLDEFDALMERLQTPHTKQ